MTPLLCTASPPLRSAMLSCRLQPALFVPSCNYYSTTAPSSRLHDVQKRPLKQSPSPSPSTSSTTITRSSSQLSHTPSPTTPPTATTCSTRTSTNTTPDRLDWNTFFRLRKVRRRYNLAASIGSSIGTTMMGVSVLSQQDLDALGGQVFGLDPFVVLGLTTAGFGAIGWLAGPFVGGAAFNVLNRRFRAQIAEVSVFSSSCFTIGTPGSPVAGGVGVRVRPAGSGRM